MSTKIYNAYICKLGLPYLHRIINELRDEYYEEVKKILKNIPDIHLRDSCINHFNEDNIVLYPLKNGDILFQIWQHQLNSIIAVNFPTLDLMLQLNKIQDYHYQNQADPWYALEFYDNKITKEDHDKWELEYIQREKDWNELFDKNVSWVPAEVGYIIPFINNKTKLIWEE